MSTLPPNLQGHVDRALSTIDWSRPAAVLYLRGIGVKKDWETEIKPDLARRLVGADVSLSEVPYDNVALPTVGEASGKAVLSEVLRQVRERAPQMRVGLAGVSLGAWVIGDTLGANPGLRDAVTAAALISHSNVARNHYPTTSGPVREFNIPGDRFSMPYRGTREKMVTTLDRLYKGITPGSLARSLPMIARNPLLFKQFADWRAGRPTPHSNVDPQLDAALGWVRLELDKQAAAPAAKAG